MGDQLDGEARDQAFDDHQRNVPQDHGLHRGKGAHAETRVALDKKESEQQNAPGDGQGSGDESVPKRPGTGPGKFRPEQHA